MARCGRRVALLAVCWATTLSAQAQYHAANGNGGAVPGAPPVGNLNGTVYAPFIGPSDGVLPARPGCDGHAPTCEPPYRGRGWYASVGTLYYQRERPGNSTLAYLDPGRDADTGISPRAVDPTAADFDQLGRNTEWGLRGTLGYRLDDCRSVEVAGFHWFDNTVEQQYIAPRRLNTLFFNPPLGFSGNAGLWLQADLIRTTLQTSLTSFEANYRQRMDLKVPGTTWEWIAGLRYFEQRERLGIFTDDDGISIFSTGGLPDPLRQADYIVRTRNHLVAPQLGFELGAHMFPRVSLTVAGKGSWGVNWIDNEVVLRRGDGRLGVSQDRSETTFSHLYEGGLFLDFHLGHRGRLRAGYNVLWLVDAAEAVRGVDFDLANQNRTGNTDASILYHGALVELRLLF